MARMVLSASIASFRVREVWLLIEILVWGRLLGRITVRPVRS